MMRPLCLGALAVALVLAISPRVMQAEASNDQPSVLVVRAGDGENGYAINAFLPASFTVSAGSTVRWEFPWFEPHTVTFGVPQAGAPQSSPTGSAYAGDRFHTSDLTFGPDKSYEVRFPTPGAYPFYCVTHAEMRGTVTVIDGPGDDQVATDARGGLEFTAALVDLKAIASDWASRPDMQSPLPDGSREHVVAIAGATSYGDVQQFFPPRVTIREGDTVRWHSAVKTPHTATFGPFPGGLPIVDNPAVAEQFRPGEAYDGSGYWNSGAIGVDWPLGLDFEMKFARPGTYLYYCILHDTQGMVGEIVVLPATGPPPAGSATATPITPRPPATGNAGQDEVIGGRPLGVVGLIVVVSLLGVTLAIVTTARRR